MKSAGSPRQPKLDQKCNRPRSTSSGQALRGAGSRSRVYSNSPATYLLLTRSLPSRDVPRLYSLRMLSCRLKQRTHPSLWAALGFLCCALIICAAVVQVGHIHADAQSLHPDCALCHTAHVVVQPPIPQSLAHIVWIVEATTAPPQPIRAKDFSVFSLFTRPPPVDLAFA
jgi:hypothetical protein